MVRLGMKMPGGQTQQGVMDRQVVSGWKKIQSVSLGSAGEQGLRRITIEPPAKDMSKLCVFCVLH